MALLVSVPRLYFEFRTMNVLSWSTMIHPRQIGTVPAPRQLKQADLSSIDYYISDCHKRGGTVTINFIQAALAGPLRGDIVDYLRMHGCKQLKVELDDGRIMYHEVADDRLKSRDK